MSETGDRPEMVRVTGEAVIRGLQGEPFLLRDLFRAAAEQAALDFVLEDPPAAVLRIRRPLAFTRFDLD